MPGVEDVRLVSLTLPLALSRLAPTSRDAHPAFRSTACLTGTQRHGHCTGPAAVSVSHRQPPAACGSRAQIAPRFRRYGRSLTTETSVETIMSALLVLCDACLGAGVPVGKGASRPTPESRGRGSLKRVLVLSNFPTRLRRHPLRARQGGWQAWSLRKSLSNHLIASSHDYSVFVVVVCTLEHVILVWPLIGWSHVVVAHWE